MEITRSESQLKTSRSSNESAIRASTVTFVFHITDKNNGKIWKWSDEKTTVIPLVMANETGRAQHRTAGHLGRVACDVWESLLAVRRPVKVHLDWGHGP